MGLENAMPRVERETRRAETISRPATAEDLVPPLTGRLDYQKPMMRAIDLAAEEVLAVGCKLAGGPGGPIGASCTASSCFSAGS